MLLNIIRSRSSRAELARRLPTVPKPENGSVQVVVYFADSRVNMYQIRQWYAPLAELAKTRQVAIIARSPGTMLTLLDESPVAAVYLRQVADLERFIHSQDIKIVFYVNQNAKNFQMFRYGRMWHVFINHGESDKMYMTTNQFKAYDYALVAGDAAKERLARKLWDFDVERRAIPIGRPQADHFAGAQPYPADGRTVVLYAPTWEGDRPSAAYGSIATHGVALVGALLASPQHRVVYRPHPRSGVIDHAYGAANRSIIAAIAAANAADPAAHHVFDDGNELGWQLAGADVAITDVSAMVYDRLATGKPLIVARPVSPAADVDESGYLGAAEWLTSEAAGDIVAIADRVQHSAEAQENLHFWVERHFGDTGPGAATARFHAAVEQLVERWDEHAALHEGDADSSEDPFDDDVDEDAIGED
ncbi:CDP-glycerol glycerophosphotransferase family protein [Conyzicola lurida]